MGLTGENNHFIFVLSALHTGTHCSVTDNSEVTGRVQAACELNFDNHGMEFQRAQKMLLLGKALR